MTTQIKQTGVLAVIAIDDDNAKAIMGLVRQGVLLTGDVDRIAELGAGKNFVRVTDTAGAKAGDETLHSFVHPEAEALEADDLVHVYEKDGEISMISRGDYSPCLILYQHHKPCCTAPVALVLFEEAGQDRFFVVPSPAGIGKGFRESVARLADEGKIVTHRSDEDKRAAYHAMLHAANTSHDCGHEGALRPQARQFKCE